MSVVYVLFFLSGAAGLVYQVLWSRLLNEVFGVTIYAVTAVLVTFLGGLALGGVVLGRVADRRTNPLRFYGWLEIGIGLTALAGTFTVRALDPLHIYAANHLAPASAPLIFVRMILAAIVVLPPTFLMGGTLPAITRAFVGRISHLGRQLSFLYALNALGAVVGTLLSGFLLIRLVGVHATLWLAVAVNVAIGLACLRLSSGRVAGAAMPAADPLSGPEPAPAQSRDGGAVALTSGGRSLLLVMAVCGFASLGLEVVWSRMLVMIVGTSTYAFVTMLASFLVGITLGSFIARLFVDRIRDVRVALGLAQAGIAISTLATIPIMAGISGEVGSRWLGGTDAAWLGTIFSRFAISFAVMFLPTTFIGMTFPLAGKIWAREIGSLGGHLGQVYGANTLGNILGAGITGFALLPAIGLQKCVALMGGMSLANAAWALYPLVSGRRGLLKATVGLPLAAGAVVMVWALVGWRPEPFLIRIGQQAKQVIFYKEGPVGTTMVYQDRTDARMRSMAIDNIKIGESFGGVDMKQQGLAHFPFLLMPWNPPRNLLSVGLGTGILIGDATRHPSVQQVDCIELEPSVIEGARLFDAFNNKVLDNPKVRVICDDGVNFLRRSPKRYDAIVSDAKSRTTHSGNALVLSQDYYELCRSHLSPGGLMIQWIACDVPSDELRTVFRTFFLVFPYSYVWLDPPSCFMVATEEPLVLDVPWIQKQLDEPAAANLRRYGWANAYGFVSLLIGDKKSLAGWLSGETTVNSLEHPVLEFYSPRSFAVAEGKRTVDNLETLAGVRRNPPETVKLVGADPAAVETNGRAAAQLYKASVLLERREPNLVPEALDLLDQAMATAPEHGVLQRVATNAHVDWANALMMQGRFDEAITSLEKAVSSRPEYPEARFNLGNALASRMRFSEAADQYREVLKFMPDFAGAHFNLGNVLASLGDYTSAALHFRRTLELQPDLAAARQRLDKVLQLERAGATGR